MGKIQIGSLWAIKNWFWWQKKGSRNFAWNQPEEQFHPGLIIYDNNDDFTYQLAPGTSKNNNRTIYDIKKKRFPVCVFDVFLFRKSFFLMDLSAPVTKDELTQFNNGWNRIRKLSNKKVNSLTQQYKICQNS
jgi:hypothetical protein